MASEGCGAFSTLPLSPPFSSAFQPLTPCFLLQTSPFLPFSLSSCPLCLWLFFRFYLRSPRTLRRTITILYLDHKKARERFWYETPKMQLDRDLRRCFKDLNKIIYTPFGWYLYFLRLVQSSTIEPKCLALFTVCVGSRPIVLLNRVVQSFDWALTTKSARLNQPRLVEWVNRSEPIKIVL